MKTILLLCFFCLNLNAYTRSPCQIDLERNFFTYESVVQGLSLNVVFIPQSSWSQIASSVVATQGGLEGAVESIAASLPRNPFEPPVDGEVAQKILLNEAFKILQNSMNYYGVRDIGSQQQTFNYIVSQNAARLSKCFPPLKNPKR